MPEVIFQGPDGRLEGRFHPQRNLDSPIAIILFVLLSRATIDGLSTTILSLCIMRVFAVPRSIAISSVKKPMLYL